MRPCTVLLLILALILLLGTLGYCSYSCVPRQPTESVYPPTTAPPAIPTPATPTTVTPLPSGSIDINLASGKVSKQVNPTNGTTMNKHDFSPVKAYGFQIYLVGTEFNGNFYVLFRTQLAVTRLTYAGTGYSATTFPQFLEMKIAGPPGKDYLFMLPLSARSSVVTLNFEPKP